MSFGALAPRRAGAALPTWLISAGIVVAAGWIATNGLQSHHVLTHETIPLLMAPVALWLFLSQRYELTLGFLLLYLGLGDGWFKLASGSQVATLGRDGLLYAITLGAVARMIIKKTPLRLPSFAGLVIAWIAVCLIQVANPSDLSTTHAMVALRQHLEFVPLFFFGYVILRSERRLLGLFILLGIVAAANGIVSLIQSGLSPAQLSAWGPGYATLENGGGASLARTFVSGGVFHVRPPGLGGTDGFGGLVCLLAVPALIALLSSARNTLKLGWLLVPATVLAILGIVTSEARLDVVSAIVAVLAYLGLTLTSRRGVAVVLVTAVVGAIAYLTVTTFVSTHASRYSTIAPSKVLGTSLSARSGSLAVIPTYLMDYPLGAGIGSVGPAGASAVGGSAAARQLNGETEFTFLLVETGIPGLLVMMLFFGAMIRAGLALRRVADPALQRALMAIAAVIISLSLVWFIAPVTADSPTAPFIWLAAGCLAYWYGEMRAGRIATRPRRLRASLSNT